MIFLIVVLAFLPAQMPTGGLINDPGALRADGAQKLLRRYGIIGCLFRIESLIENVGDPLLQEAVQIGAQRGTPMGIVRPYLLV